MPSPRAILAASLLSLLATGFAAATPPAPKRICIVSSYHAEYLWSQDTNRGVCQAMVKLGYLTADEAKAFTAAHEFASDRVVLKKLWMDTKRQSSRSQMIRSMGQVVKAVRAFKPDILMLGDDNAANLIGNVFIDHDLPVVFWGVNGLPLRYGLIDSLQRPGHNVTGVYQAGYMKESLTCLHKLIPEAENFAILSDDSPTGRSKAKELQHLARQGKLSLRLVETVVTNDVDEWKQRAIALADKVDAFFILNHNTLKDASGQPVPQLEIGSWYLQNIRKPECAHERQFAVEGILCVVDDSGFKQGYEAMKIVHSILAEGASPSEIPVRAPSRGPFIVNRERAEMLGIRIGKDIDVGEYIDEALALKHRKTP